MEIILLNGCKEKEKIGKTRHVKNNEKSKKDILRGHRDTRYHERILSNANKSYKINFISIST